MTLGVLEGHSPITSLLNCDISYLWRVARSHCICRASCWTKICTYAGDYGHFDERGNLFIVDRLKELLKYKGFQVKH